MHECRNEVMEALLVSRRGREIWDERQRQEMDNPEPDKNCYPVRNAPVVTVRKRGRPRTADPPDQAGAQDREPVNAIGTLASSGDTLAAGSGRDSSVPVDTLRTLSRMQGAPTKRLHTVGEVIAEDSDADRLERMGVIEREAAKVYQGEQRGARRPTVLMGLLKGWADIISQQTAIAKHMPAERAVPVEWQRIRDAVILTLQGYPEALAAVSKVLEGEGDD